VHSLKIYVGCRVTRRVCEKVAHNISQCIFCQNHRITCTMEKNIPKI
jgi:hypothetical protein